MTDFAEPVAMPLDKLLIYAARCSWRHRWWWIFGLMATAGGLLTSLAFRGGSWSLAGGFSAADLDLQDWLDRFTNPGLLIGGVMAAFAILTLLWLVSVVAEGGLIVAVAGRDENDGPVLARALRQGIGLLGRFIGIDTLLFLPIFLLVVLLLVIGFGGLAGLVLAATSPSAQLSDLLLVAGLATGVSIPVILLMMATGAFIIVLRNLAFRATVIDGLNATESIRWSWSLLRRSALSIVVLALVLAAMRSLAGLPVRIGSLLVAGLGWAQFMSESGSPGPEQSAISLVAVAIGVILAILGWLVGGVMNAYGSASWTISYEKWTQEAQGAH